MAKNLKKALSLITVFVMLLSMAVSISAESATIAVNKIIPIASFSKGQTDALHDAYCTSAVSITDELPSALSGKALKWDVKGNRFAVNVNNNGASEINGTVKFRVNVYSEFSEQVRAQVRLCDTVGSLAYNNANYPLEPGNNTINIELNNDTFWAGSGQAYFWISFIGKSDEGVLYVQDIYFDCQDSIEKQRETEKKIPVAAFDDGNADELHKTYCTSAVTVIDEIPEGFSGQALKWNVKGNRFAVNVNDTGISNIDGKVTFSAKVYSEFSEQVRAQVRLCDTVGSLAYNNANYPLEPGNNTINIELNNDTFWAGSGQAYFWISFIGKSDEGVIYIDDIYFKYNNVEGTDRYMPWNLELYNLNQPVGTAVSSLSMQNYNGAGFVDDAYAPGSSTSLRYRLENATGKETIFYLGNFQELDYTQYENIVFRMKAENATEDSTREHQTIEFLFSPYKTDRNGILKSAYACIDKEILVGEWTDVKFKISDLKAGNGTTLIGPNSGRGNTVKTMLFSTEVGGDFEAGAKIYVDSVYLEKKADTAVLNAPVVNVVENAVVPTYINNDKTVTFAFDEELFGGDYNRAVKVTLNDELSDDMYYAVKDGNNLKVVFANALKPNANYAITLRKDSIRSASNKMLSDDYIVNFTTGDASVEFEDVVISDADSVIEATVVAKNTSVKKSGAVIFIAEFTGSKMTNVIMKPIEIKSAAETVEGAEIAKVAGCTYKAFLWSNDGKLSPLTNSDTL